MVSKDKDIPFEKSIYPWSLTFRDPKYEAGFHQIMRTNKHLTFFYKLLAYALLTSAFGYRFFAIVSLSTTRFIETASMPCEIFLTLFQLAGLLIEVVLKYFDKLQRLQGFFLYTALSVATFAASFYTQNKPVFGLVSAISFMVGFPAALIFLNTWMATGVAGVITALYVLIDYVRLFGGTISKATMGTHMFFVITCINFTTVFSFGLEQGYRKLYFLEKEMKKEKKKWKTALDSLPVGIVLATSANALDFINKEAMDYLGPDTATSHSFLIRPPDESSTQQNLADAEPPISVLDKIADPANGTTLKEAIELEAGTTPTPSYNMVHEKTKKVYEVKTKLASGTKIAVVKDQTVYRELVKEQMLEKYLRMLLASISHEVRNPLNAIEGYLDLMISDIQAGVDKVKEFVTKIRYSAKHIGNIVTGACYLVSSQGGTIVVQPEKFVIVEAVQEVLQMVTYDVDATRVTVQFQTRGGAPETTYSDPGKYKLILFNLLKNAVKYTSRGSIKVTLSVDDTGSFIETSVTDTGCGISEEKRGKLFELYGNVDSANVYNPQGMGLGLTLCKKLTKVLGGEITVESVPKEGTTFVFTIKRYSEISLKEAFTTEGTERQLEENRTPREEEIRIFIPIHSMSALNSSPTGPDAKKVDWTTTVQVVEPKKASSDTARALIVDDEPTNRLVIGAYLAGIKVKADHAENGLVALQKVTEKAKVQEKYSLILMDINMPIMDGTTATAELTKMFREDPLIKAPIIAVTAANLHTRKDIQGLLSVGFEDIFQKPVTRNEFIAKVRHYFD